jgi:HEAT repeat protein
MSPQNAPERRWQAAYGLSASVLANKDDLPVGFAAQIIAYFDHAITRDDEDPRFRQFLALILLNLEDRSAIPVLKKAITSDIDVETRICAVIALSEIGVVEDELSPLVLTLIRDPDPAIRKVGTYAAGRVGGPATLEPLRDRLTDTELDVRWNAALSLARRGDPSGSTLLESMVQRTYVRDSGNLDFEAESAVVRNALIALAQLDITPDEEYLTGLAADDKDAEVRRLANEALLASQAKR